MRGELLAKQKYQYEQLEQIPGAGELIGEFSGLLYRSSEEFETPGSSGRGVAMRWRSSSPTSGILTLRCASALASVSLLASGLNVDADHLTFQAFQHHLVRGLHDTETEPAFALMDLTERPIVATINFESPAGQTDRLTVALADRCFAAAYFRFLQLA